ncbi:hypothetical protein SAMN04488494_0581 [Xylanibacter ruminicola]|uniref:Uncharacterized protein n=1 Tax=Xylanibacter ruminicola TaxID=839 RepID=A0A1M7CZV8_XYLRU|nr:hypothetical protein [Xylanibacter ruminicola]SHL72782.1 hypothetical protein SAMN04488494_0581 [Xylanibacter ruminicola]
MKVIRTTAIFRCVVTFKNGTHKILRMTIDLVAKVTTKLRECQKNIFRDESWFILIGGEYLNLSEIAKAKFINERTEEEFVTIA